MLQRSATAFAVMTVLAACGPTGENRVDTTTAAGNVEPSMDTVLASEPAELPTTDAGVVELEMAIDRHEVEVAKLAIDKTEQAEVKRFAREIADEHARDTTAIGHLALREKIVATGLSPGGGILGTLKTSHEKTMEALRASSGAAFDRSFMDAIVDGHQQALEVLQHTHHGVQNAQLQNHVSSAITMAQRHLDRAIALVRAMERGE